MECKYLLPCGYCDKFDTMCSKNKETEEANSITKLSDYSQSVSAIHQTPRTCRVCPQCYPKGLVHVCSTTNIEVDPDGPCQLIKTTLSNEV